MFNNKLTEQELEIKKRENRIKRDKKIENIKEKIGDFFYNVSNIIKYITRKKTEEEIALTKREKWLNRSKKMEIFKLKLNEYFTKKNKQEEQIIEENPFNKEEIIIEDNYDITDFQGLLSEFDINEEKDEDLNIIEENFKIKNEISKENVIKNTNRNKIRNLKIAKVTLGTILTISGTIILSKQHHPLNVIQGITVASTLNIGIYTIMNGLLTTEKEKEKIKVFKDLSSIGE